MLMLTMQITPNRRGLQSQPGREFTRRSSDSSAACFRSGKPLFGMIILAIFLLMAIFAPVIAPGDPTRFVGRQNQPPSAAHWLGTTGQGQDVLAQVIVGSRISLLVGFTVGLLITLSGLVIGMTLVTSAVLQTD